MPIIKHNPFRILGLTGNATEKELRKRISMLKRYAEVGKTKSFDYDFKFIGEFTRNSYEIQQASNSIEQAHKKLLYSLFWFIKNNPFDEIAFNNLKEGNTEKAIEIWNKTLKKEITSKNYSSYLNLSTLYIALSTIDDQIELQKLQAGILLKGNLIHSENLKDFSKLVTGNGIVNDSIEISKKFVDEVVVLLKPYTDKKNGISTNDLISLFKTFPFPISIQKYISAKFTEIPISNIDNKIEKTTRKRKDNPRDAEEYGEELYKSTESDITLLKKLMGSSNVQFQMIANKLANEILQCSIDFFNKHRDEGSKFDPGDDAMKIAKYAKSIGPTGQTKNRIDEAITFIKKWVDERPNRQLQVDIEEDIAFIAKKLKRFIDTSESNPHGIITHQPLFVSTLELINDARDIVVSCKPKLTNIKNKLGSYDDSYLQISSAVVGNTLRMIIEAINNDISIELSTIYLAAEVIEEMECFDMISEVRSRFDANKRIIDNIIREQQEISRRSSSSRGCYIATMAYGDYDHPQVMILRKFRDETLSNTFFGRSFIKFYYAISPYLVKLLKNKEYLNKKIRNLLDQFVNNIKQ